MANERYYLGPPYRWGSITGLEGLDGIHLRHEERGGRLVLTGLYLHGPEITARLLRALQLQQHSTYLAQAKADRLRKFLANPDRAAEVAADDAKTTIAKLESLATTADVYRGPVKFKPRSLAYMERLRSEDFDAFCGAVALWYTARTAHSKAPAKEMAEEIGAPVSRVHMWIREARIRGTLPPARRGVAG